MKCPECSTENPADTRYCGQCGTPFDMESIPTVTIQAQTGRITRGSVLGGRYEIIEEIGRGGMGWVFKTYDQKIDEKIAIKLINPAVAQDPSVLERFNNELKIARKIVHKNVCRMYELTEADGMQFITMEYIQGEDLKSLINRIGQFTLRKTVAIARQICDGLEEAHALGIVHRDLKPQNIMIDLKGNVRITDFGIAQSIQSRGLTKTGMIIGTPEYMSPEQVEGIPIDQRADIYSLGIIIYEMLTGVVPFEGDTPMSLAMKHKSERPRAPRTINGYIPDPLDHLILRCLEKDPEKRYQSAQELNKDLAIIEHELPTTEGVPLKKPEKKKETRTRASRPEKKANWAIPAAIGVSVLAVVLIIVWITIIIPGKKSRSPISEPGLQELVESGLTLWRDQMHAEALTKFEAALALDPAHYKAQFHLARILRELGRVDESIPAYERAIALDPDKADPYKELGEIFQQKQEIEQALAFYKDFLGRIEAGTEADRIRRIVQDLESDQAKLDHGSDKAETQTEEDKPEFHDAQAERDAMMEANLRLARKAFDDGRFLDSMALAREVLKTDRGHEEAQNILEQSELSYDTAFIGTLVTAYATALEKSQLSAFYRVNCTPQLYSEIKDDAVLITNLYTDFKSQVTNRNIRFLEENRAEVSFGHRITGTSKQEGTEQQLFQGNMYWDLHKINGEWKIAGMRTES